MKAQELIDQIKSLSDSYKIDRSDTDVYIVVQGQRIEAVNVSLLISDRKIIFIETR